MSTSKFFDSKYLKNGDIYEVGPQEHLYVRPTGFRLAPSHLTLDDLKWSEIKVILSDVKHVKNGKSCDFGSNGDYIECPWMTSRG